MNSTDVSALTTAFDTTALFDTFVLFAPWIITILGILIGVSLVKWGVKKIRAKLSGGM